MKHEINFKKMIRKYGFINTRKAAKLHEKINELDKEAFDVVSDIDAYFANRKLAWNLTKELIRMEA